MAAGCGVAASALAISPLAMANELRTAGFNGGELIVSANDAFTAASIHKLSFAFDECGTDPNEESCTWKVEAVLKSDPARRCVPSTPESAVIWESAAQSGNGKVESGLHFFPLEGCRGQTLLVYHEYMKRYRAGEGEPPPPIVSGGLRVQIASVTFGYHPAREAEEAVIRGNPAATIAPHPVPAPSPLRFARGCRSLTIGAARYAFVFKRLGCRTAKNLARMFYISRADPSGYRCLRRPGGRVRCWREGRPTKYVEWRPPRKQGTRAAHRR